MSDLNCCCNDLLPMMTKLLEQNNRLIEQHEVKDEIILQSLQQNNDLLAQMVEQEEPEGSQFLDG